MATRSKWQHLATEAVNPRSRDIDMLTPDDIVEVMVLDNRHVLAAVQREIDELEGKLAETRAEMARHLKELGLVQ